MFQTFISRHNSNFFSDKLVLTSVTPASSAPVLQTPKATSSTLYFDSLTVNAGNGGFLHCIQMDTSVNAANQVVSEIGRAVQQECRDRSRMPSSAGKKKDRECIGAASLRGRARGDARASPARRASRWRDAIPSAAPPARAPVDGGADWCDFAFDDEVRMGSDGGHANGGYHLIRGSVATLWPRRITTAGTHELVT